MLKRAVGCGSGPATTTRSTGCGWSARGLRPARTQRGHCAHHQAHHGLQHLGHGRSDPHDQADAVGDLGVCVTGHVPDRLRFGELAADRADLRDHGDGVLAEPGRKSSDTSVAGRVPKAPHSASRRLPSRGAQGGTGHREEANIRPWGSSSSSRASLIAESCSTCSSERRSNTS